jgi:GTP cyclohydrolase I
MAIKLTDSQIDQYCLKLADKINRKGQTYEGIFPIPMGGYPVAIKLSKLLDIPIVDYMNPIVLIVDDLIDSGRTLSKYPDDCDTAVLFAKNKKYLEVNYYAETLNDWIVFPWETLKEENADIKDHIIRILEYIGEDTDREGLKDTPKRIIKSWEKLYGGYKQDPKKLLTTFKTPNNYDEMIILKDIEFYSTCEHHMLNFSGFAHIAYIPNDKVIGVSKLARLLEIYARRLQIQERLTKQITDFLMNELNAKGAGCILEAQHLCTSARGIEKQKSKMITSSLDGVFRKKPEVRMEFLNLINLGGNK